MLLDGIRVVELTLFLVGPRAGSHLADLGAEVLKIEHPQGGDPMRTTTTNRGALPPMKDINFMFELENRGKKSITLDVGKEGGQEIAHRLVEQADVFISNFQVPVLKRLRMDYGALSAINPRLVYALCTGWGMRGPDKDRPGFDYAVFAESGLAHSFGEPGGLPVQCRPGFGDHITAITLAYGIMAALYHRQRTGEGQLLHASILGSLIEAGALSLQAQLSTGEEVGPVSRKDMANALWNFYQTKDGQWLQFAMVQPDRHWHDFCAALNMEKYENDPRFSNHPTREANRHELIRIIDEVMASRTRREWLERFQGKNLIYAPIVPYSEVARNPQLTANDYVVQVEHQSKGSIPLVGLPVNFSRTPGRVRSGAPELGQHTEETLLDLGYTWEDIGGFKENGVIL
ncbi:MAG: CoA transferase [Chloroflexi bacterium]|nr:CoA transferase [Chloroflexota bacterium]